MRNVLALRPLLLVFLAGLLVALPQPAAAQIHSCGPFEIVFRNPDLQPGTDGFITAEGQFFAQFQVIGDGADKVTTMGFSFGAYTRDFTESEVCNNPPQAWFTGQQILNYRADTDPDDGFFINLQTPLVPDGEYTAAVHAYDAGNNELGRFWAKAIVNNCDAPGPAPPARCDGDEPQNTKNDRTGPWPMILPGDGQKLPDGTTGFSLEFAEVLSSLVVYLDGQDITAQMEQWPGRLWDDDLIPGYGPYGLGNILVPECSQQPPQTCSNLGVAYRWNTRALTKDDVIRVEAADMAGNRAVKDIHIGSSVAGGAITDAAPNLQITVDEVAKTTTPGQAVVFRFQITNSGGGTAHPFTSKEGPAGWTLEWTPHKPVEPGGTDTQELTVTPPPGTAAGEYPINATISYPEGGTQKDNGYALKVIVGGAAPVSNAASTTGDGKKSPGLAPVLLLASLALAAVAMRRR
ncbi:MAG: NPCBM-associated, domain of alpha-galactosidase [Thermoplasmata archaeon]|nr:NPCBM-associated, domain of alpha-galactosidase [Thermoplasmata archaeon]